MAQKKGPLHGQVVCVTGASRGLGRAVARLFSAEGASLVLAARTAGEIDELAAELGNAIAVATDVRSPGDCQRMIDAAVGEFGRLDILVNNAGLAVYGPFESMSPDDVNAMIDTNLKGLLWCCQAAFPVMKRQRRGLILNVSSVAGKLHLPNESVYCASKWAVNGLSGVLRAEVAPFNVKVTTVCPGGIDTPFWNGQEFLPFPENVDPQRDFMRAEEVARSMLEVALKSDRYTIPELVMIPLLGGA